MRKVTGGDGSDTTAAVQAYLTSNNSLWLANLYMIGEPEDPAVIMITDFDRPLTWSWVGTFWPGVTKRGKISSKIGLEVTQFDFQWSPKNRVFTSSVVDTSPLQLAATGYYDNKPVRVWRVFMPRPCDANTFGAAEWFGGRIASTVVDRQWIKWTVNSWLEVIDQQTPSNVIENTNPLASFAGANPPAGFATIPQFSVVAPSDNNTIYGTCINFPSTYWGINKFQYGWLIFNYGSNATLAGMWGIIGGSGPYPPTGSPTANKFQIYAQLPWPPTPGVDTFFVSAPMPLDQHHGGLGVNNFPFPGVPAPEGAA